MAFVTRPALVASDFVKPENKVKQPEDKKKPVKPKKKAPVKKVIKKAVPSKKFVGRPLPWN